MKNKIAILFLAVVAFAVTAAFAGSENPVVPRGQQMYPTKDILDSAVNSACHGTLVAALRATGLVDTLKGSGPFTVFAPTSEAFTKLPGGHGGKSVKARDKDALSKILTYHVVSGQTKRHGPQKSGQGWQRKSRA